MLKDKENNAPEKIIPSINNQKSLTSIRLITSISMSIAARVIPQRLLKSSLLRDRNHQH